MPGVCPILQYLRMDIYCEYLNAQASRLLPHEIVHLTWSRCNKIEYTNTLLCKMYKKNAELVQFSSSLIFPISIWKT